jgi:hypothetical protein
MSETEPKGVVMDQPCPYSSKTGFDQALESAQKLFEKSDTQGALEILGRMEKQYIRAARLFGLMGDILLQKGEADRGVKYKRLHEMLKSTFDIATAPCTREQTAKPAAEDVSLHQSPQTAAESGAEFESLPEFPLTAEMGRELMRQGHYKRAVEIFTKLSHSNPADRSLEEARDRAMKKNREKELLGVLQRWLGGVQQLKSGRSH